MLFLLTTLTFFSSTSGHSWLTCTDYTEKNGDVNDHSKCRGWPRGANIKISNTSKFGVSKGFHHEPKETMPCQMNRDDEKYYDANHPMAVYFRGQQVVLTHPMKGHGADGECKDNAVDTGNYIYSSEKDPTKDPKLSQFRSNLIFDLSRSIHRSDDPQSSIYPKYGFHNAPQYCKNPDEALGTYSFNVPMSLKSGLYTFMWIWAFKNSSNLYSTCFEVKITDTIEQRNQELKKLNIDDLLHPCGGDTSNPDVEGSKIGCNSSTKLFVNFFIVHVSVFLSILIR